MDEYVMVPAERLAQMQINKEPPEAAEVISLDNLTSKILRRKDISDWEKASMLSSTLERFLALKPRALDEVSLPVVAPVVQPTLPVPDSDFQTPKVLKKSRRKSKAVTSEPQTVIPAKPKRQLSPVPFEPRPQRNRQVPRRLQEGAGLKKWIYL